jgi:hypothetical protein
VFNPGLAAPVIGASGAISAMMGGVMRFLFNAIDRREGYLLREQPRSIPRMSLAQSLKDRRIVLASLVFVGVNLLAIVGFGKFGESGAIAWEAHSALLMLQRKTLLRLRPNSIECLHSRQICLSLRCSSPPRADIQWETLRKPARYRTAP